LNLALYLYRQTGAVFHFEWIVPGLTAVCFWTAPRRLIGGLDGHVGSGSPRLRHARLSPNRCLAGLLVRAAF
jgi:hypothetical protein